MISKALLKAHSHCAFVPVTAVQRLSETAVWQVRLSEVRQQIVADSRSSCTEGSIAEVGPSSTDEKHTKSVSRAQSSWVCADNDAAVANLRGSIRLMALNYSC